MLYSQRSQDCAVVLAVIAACVAPCAGQQASQTQRSTPQTGNSSTQQAATPEPKSLSAKLGVVVYPAKDQTPQQQNTDETSCFSWAKEQTGIDPAAPPPQAAPAQPQQAQQPASNP